MTISAIFAAIPCGGALKLAGDQLAYEGPPGSLSPDLRALLIEHKDNLLTYLRHPTIDHSHQRPVNVADELKQAIRQATTWGGLEVVLEQAQAAFERDALTADLMEALAIQAAQAAQALPEQVEELRLSELFDEHPVRRLPSKVLGEIVVFAADGVEIPPDNDPVVYRESELRQISGRSPEQVRAIHATKKAFDGELIATPAGERVGGIGYPRPRGAP